MPTIQDYLNGLSQKEICDIYIKDMSTWFRDHILPESSVINDLIAQVQTDLPEVTDASMYVKMEFMRIFAEKNPGLRM